MNWLCPVKGRVVKDNTKVFAQNKWCAVCRERRKSKLEDRMVREVLIAFGGHLNFVMPTRHLRKTILVVVYKILDIRGDVRT